ncbi:hypothetical protein ACWOFR_11995 [Carnobacterium gallinarum]|uniref:hypothetical protein n=1 Tax=Carnobacterium gallinarum TaxID=2749 RepID=UPI0005546216|nr:hypothetical protein [Carnobacterium gallinarum]
MKARLAEVKKYIGKVKNQELSKLDALIWLREHYQELSLHDLSLLTALIDQPRVFYQLEREKLKVFFASLEEEDR